MDCANRQRLAWNVRLPVGQFHIDFPACFAPALQGKPTESTMYLVELQPGTEVLYNSVAELTSAIRSGDVGSQSWIYHRASSTWVPITVHPEYKRVSGEPLPLELPPLKRKRWTFFNAEGVDEPVTIAQPVHASRAEIKPGAASALVPQVEKPGLRQLVRGAMRWLRVPGAALSQAHQRPE